MFIKIDNETMEVIQINFYSGNLEVETDNGEYVIFKSQEDAGKAAREYWVDLAEYDEQEFMYLVGEGNLLKWAMGKSAGPGSTQVESLEDWFDLWLDTPEEHFGRYDGNECEVNFISRDFLRELDDDMDWIESIRNRNCVAYRA